MAKQISELSWKKRLLLISYAKQDDPILTQTKKFIYNNRCEIEDRNLEVIFFEKFKNKEFATPKFINKKYGIWLIGYDGMIKNYNPTNEIFISLFDLIDTMPMRKTEIKNDKC